MARDKRASAEEIHAMMFAETLIDYVIIIHSNERKTQFGVTIDNVSVKGVLLPQLYIK